MMLRTPFEEELAKLHNQFYAMGTEVTAQLKKQYVPSSAMTVNWLKKY